MRDTDAIREKATILRVGEIAYNDAGEPVAATGWVFGTAPAGLTVSDDGMLLGGYTVKELAAIAAA